MSLTLSNDSTLLLDQLSILELHCIREENGRLQGSHAPQTRPTSSWHIREQLSFLCDHQSYQSRSLFIFESHFLTSFEINSYLIYTWC